MKISERTVKRLGEKNSLFKILIDTCVWLDLAKDYQQQPILTALEEFIRLGNIELILPRIVLDEFARNKGRVVEESSRSLSGTMKRVKEAVEKFGDPRKKSTVLRQLNDVDHRIPTLGEAAVDTVSRIEKLFARTPIIEISDSVKVRAAQRAIDKRAPFHRQRNGIDDAILIEVHADVVGAKATGTRLDQITRDVIETLRFSGASSNANCALRTLRRMLHKAEEWTLIRHAPKLKLMKEYGRSLRLDDEAEKKLLAGAAACNWRKRSLQLFRDIIILIRDTGMRNERELYRMRIENLDWETRVIFVPDSKTEEGRRRVPMSNRVFDVLKQRCEGRREGWVFPSKRAESAHLTTMAKRFREARVKAGLPADLVLFCGRHDYGTRILKRTGNLAAVMRTMGHRDVKTAMQYQHPELEIVRAALDQDTTVEKRA